MKSTKKKVIVVTDCKDVAFNEVKLIIERECDQSGFDNVNVDLVSVEEFSLINAAFLTRLIGEQAGAGTTISIIINPLKNRTARIFGRLKNGVLFFGANTGVITWLAMDIGIEELWEVKDPGFVSFGGKYIHAPNVANLVSEKPFEEFGIPFDKNEIAKLEIQNGTVLHIDNFGLIKIMGNTPKFEEGQRLQVFKNGEPVIGAVYANRMMNYEDDTWVLYAGSSLNNLPELGKVRNKKGFEEIGVKIGDTITWRAG